MADKNKVYDGISRAAELMNNPQFNMLVEGYSRKNKKGKGGSNDLAMFEAQAGFGGGSSSAGRQSVPKNMASIDEIKQSFRQTPAMSGGGQSASAGYYAQMQQQQQRQMLAEQQMINQPQPQAYGGVAVDYGYIKYIVSECLKEALQSQQLNESASLSGLKMVGGNKIQFIDSKGNIFEGVLRKVQQ